MEQREIKFRGWFQGINGQKYWVYGYLVKQTNGNWEITNGETSWTVDNVGQFTGLKSSDGGCGLPIKDCYFRDIIRFYNTDGVERTAEVIWYEKELCIGFKRLSDGFVYTQRNFNDNGYFQPSKITFEIIGNIYDNTELGGISI